MNSDFQNFHQFVQVSHSIFNLTEEKAKELTLMVKNLDEAQQSSAIREVCYISGTSVKRKEKRRVLNAKIYITRSQSYL